MDWKRIKDLNYEVSQDGKVRNLKTGKIRKLSSGKNNDYLMVQLHLGCNIRQNFLVHRLVAEAFVKKPNKNKHQVNHIDGNRLNNC